MGDGATAEGDGAHRLDDERCEEEPLARAQNDRMDNKAVLVDQAGLDQFGAEWYVLAPSGDKIDND